MSSNVRLDVRAAPSTYVMGSIFALPICGVMLLDQRIQTTEDITSARTEFSSKDPFGPVMRFELELKPPSVERQIVINMKVFSRKDLHSLFEILHDKMTAPPRISIFGRD